nr:MAG: internal scaffolding protein [Microvirus sp.]
MTKIVKPFVRDPYNYDKDEASIASALVCQDPSLAQQHMKDECDINVIVERFGVTGQLPENPLSPSYGDFSGVTDYHSALNQINATMDDFMALPAQLRVRFDHDPVKLLEFIENDQNRDEAIQLGLIDGQLVVEPIVSSETPKAEG